MFTDLHLAIETLEQNVKHIKAVVIVNLNLFHTSF